MNLSKPAHVALAAFLAASLPSVSAAEPPPASGGSQKFLDHGTELLKEIVSQPWASAWKTTTLSEIRLVKPKPDLAQPTGLPPAWHAEVTAPNGDTGYLLWDATGKGGLIEFFFDSKLTIDTASAKAIPGVPPLQQFPLAGAGDKPVVSGCVPTSAASLLGWWSSKRYPQWGGAEKGDLRAIAKRIRSRLNMQSIADTDGFTTDGMALAGAMPDKLATAIQADADKHKIPIDCKFLPFSMKTLKTEIDAGRPALASCLVRVPHKPELSWGHEVAAIGYAKIGDMEFVGILDNFFPTKVPGAIRWVRADAFDSLIIVKEIAAK